MLDFCLKKLLVFHCRKLLVLLYRLHVYKDDRLGRRMWEIGGYVMSLKSLGVDIYTVKDGCISPETDDIMGQMMLALRYGNAQKSSSDTGQRVKCKS